jgi:adenylyltransferase/sulfurtransferase
MRFDETQIRRYSRHLLLRELGGVGQRKLLEASALVVGAGGLGCPAALYLAAAGVGRLTLADPDAVDLSNLHRQILYADADVGRPKAETAAAACRRANPEVAATPLPRRLSAADARDVIRGHRVVIEGSDNLETKFAINDACVAEGVPCVIGGVVRWHGQVLTVLPGRGPCYRCIFEGPPPENCVETCEQAGVIGPAAGAIGAFQAVEAIKILAGVGEPLAGRMLAVDFLAGKVREIAWSRRPGCASCGSDGGK